MPNRLYSTVAELIRDLQTSGHGVKVNEEALLNDIRSASDYIDGEIGMFIPRTEIRKYDGTGKYRLDIDPVVAVTDLTEDGDTLTEDTDFVLRPSGRMIENGAYIAVEVDVDSSSFSAWPWDQNNVVITGRWGLYENTVSLGFSLTFDDTETEKAVSDGSTLSPGMVLLIESEQLLVTATKDTLTDSTANLNGAIDIDDEFQITLTDASQVNVGEVIQINTERMRVLVINATTNQVEVDRGWDGTSLESHADAADVYVLRTYEFERGVNGTTAAAHSNKAVSRYIPPYDLGYICRQIAALMRRKADTAFAGKTANVEIGEIFYHDEFPNEPIDRMKKKYRKGLAI
jgi:hypothetical protein